jgi:cobalt-zinc-cadmium efflux system protein
VHVWQLNDDQINFEAHIDFNEDLSLSEVNKSLDQIRDILRQEFNVKHSTLQPEYNHCDKKDLIHQH